MDCTKCTQYDNLKDKINENSNHIKELEDKLNENINKNIRDRQDLKNLIKVVENLNGNVTKLLEKTDERLVFLERKVNDIDSRLAVNDSKTNKFDSFMDKLTWQMVLAIGFCVWLILSEVI